VYYNIGYGFHISLSNKDLDLLIDIKKKIKIGKIYEYPEKEEARLAITKLADLNWLIINIFEKAPLITIHQRERYLKLKYGVLNKFNRVDSLEEYNNFINKQMFCITTANVDLYENMDSKTAFDNWLLGFINGEGYFYLRNDKERRRLEFSIEHTDRFALELIKKRLDISSNVIIRPKRSLRRKETYILYISSRNNISSLIKLCTDPLLSKLKGNKLKQFNNWILHQ